MEFVFPPGRPTICGIDHEALRSNLRQIRDKVGSRVKILCMVKANGYGHGAAEISQTLVRAGADAFGVATLEEAVQLREAGIQAALIVLAGVFPAQLDTFVEYKLTPVVHDLISLKALDRESSRRQILRPLGRGKPIVHPARRPVSRASRRSPPRTRGRRM